MAINSINHFKKEKMLDLDWLGAPSVQRILSVLNQESSEPKALIVGGAVRNAILGAPVKDIDIATKLKPTEVMNLCAVHDIKTYPTGWKHGTVTAVVDDASFEITTLRRDIETDGRHAVVEYTDDWQKDAARRDFTMNALYMDADGNIYDVLGQGVNDARLGWVRFVGESKKRIEEDALRILRFYRFWAYYGSASPDEKGHAACRDSYHMLKQLSKERVTAEILKIMEAPKALEAVHWMVEAVILNDIWGDGADKHRGELGNIFALQDAKGNKNALARLFFILQMAGLNIKILKKYVVLSNKDWKFLSDLQDAQQNFDAQNLDLVAVHHMVYQYGRDVLVQILLFFNNRLRSNFEVFYEEASVWQVPQFPIDGSDLKKIGFAEGKSMGDAMKQMTESWVKSDFKMSKNQLLAQANDMLN